MKGNEEDAALALCERRSQRHEMNFYDDLS